MWEAIVKISWVYFLSCAVVLYDAFPVSLVTTGIYIYTYLEEGPPLGDHFLENRCRIFLLPSDGFECIMASNIRTIWVLPATILESFVLLLGFIWLHFSTLGHHFGTWFVSWTPFWGHEMRRPATRSFRGHTRHFQGLTGEI